MAVLYTNNASTLLTAAINTTATTLSLTGGTGALFPNPASPDYFYVTVANSGGTLEIMKCTSRATDTLTVVRAQEGTTATAYSIGDKVELRVTAAGLANKLDKDTGGTVAGPVTISGALTAGSTLSVTGATTLASTLSAGASTLASASVTGNETVGGTLGVTGAATFSSTVGVTGVLTASGGVAGNLTGNVTGNHTGPTTVGGTLGVSGLITGTAGAAISGGLTVDSFAGTGIASVSDVNTGTSTTKLVTPASLAGSSLGAAVWVRWQGQSSNGACTILKSKNVASVSRTAGGTYTVNFSTALSDANYAVAFTGAYWSGGSMMFGLQYGASPTTGSVFVISTDLSNNGRDVAAYSLIIFD